MICCFCEVKKMTEEKIKIIPMTFDKVFKSVLQDKEQEEYLVDIISSITGIEKEDITDDYWNIN